MRSQSVPISHSSEMRIHSLTFAGSFFASADARRQFQDVVGDAGLLQFIGRAEARQPRADDDDLGLRRNVLHHGGDRPNKKDKKRCAHHAASCHDRPPVQETSIRRPRALSRPETPDQNFRPPLVTAPSSRRGLRDGRLVAPDVRRGGRGRVKMRPSGPEWGARLVPAATTRSTRSPGRRRCRASA